MPEVDGCTLVESVRQEKALADIGVIMLTSGARPGDVQRCERLHIAARLMKPVIQSELFDAVGMALGITDRRPDRELATANDLTLGTRSLKILLAEDSLVNQKLAVGLLEKYGHAVAVVETGTQALDRVQSEAFDVILMDVEMPVMDGIEATIAIRELERRTGGHIPIIAMTAHAMKGDRERCIEAGMDDYVAKPIRVKELFRALQSTVDPSRR